MLFFRLFAVALLLSLAGTVSVLAQVNIIQAPSNYEFVDMGYDAASDEVGIVGYVTNGTDRTATVFELNADSDGFTEQTLANLPGATQNAEVNCISSDATRIAGASFSSNANGFEGATWLRSDVNNPSGIGFTQGGASRSSAIGAWTDGVVGESGGSFNAVTWNINLGIEALPGTNGALATAFDVNSNGQIVVGFSAHELSNGAAYYWDESGIHRLNDNIEGHTINQSIAKNISPNGDYIGGEILAIDGQGNFKVFAVVWEGVARTLRILTDSNGDFIQGTVNDVSDLGYVVGSFFDASFNSFGFIWNPDFTNGVRLFEDWLEEESPGANFPFDSLNVNSIGSGNGRLFFTVTGDVGENALVEMVFDLELGDVNQDGDVNFGDIPAFINVLAAGDFQVEADVDKSGAVDFSDIPAFIQVLISQ